MNQSISKPEPIELKVELEIKAIENELKLIGQDTEKQFHLDDLKKRYSDALIEADIAGGIKPDPERIATATKIYFDRRESFIEPKRDLPYKLAEMYVDRARIGRRYGLPTLGLLCVTALVWGSVITGKIAHRNALEKSVETRVEEVFRQDKLIDSAWANINGNIAVQNQLPESEKVRLKDDLRNSSDKLKQIDLFLDEFCPRGSAEKSVTQSNYKEVGNRVAGFVALLDTAKTDLNDANNLIGAQEELTSTRQSLDSLFAEVKNMKPGNVFETRAEVAYKNGISCLETRQLTEAQRNKENLAGIKRDITDFSHLNRKLDETYRHIGAIAKEDEAKKEADQIYSEARKFIENPDVPRLQETEKRLENLDAILGQEYTTYILDCDRRMPDNPGIRVVRYYAVLQQKDPNGRVLPKRILHEESKTTLNVDKWGYRIGEVTLSGGETPDDVRAAGKDPKFYTKIRNDINDNNVIDDSKMAVKERGYLHERITMKGVPPCGGEYPY